jgi:heptosyltransferase II
MQQLPRPERIVVRGVNWLGDAVMSTPALRRLREAYPQAHIALITPAKLADLWRHHPDVEATIAFSDSEGVLDVARRVRAEKFDLALVFPNSPRSALEVFLAGVPRRVGLARPWRNFFLTGVIASPGTEILMRKKSAPEVQRLIAQSPPPPRQQFPESAHHLFRYLDIAAAAGASREPAAPRLVVSDEEVKEVRRKFSAGEQRLVGFNPGAEYGPAKRWPMERFIETARRLNKQTGCACWVFGGAAEREAGQHFVRELSDLPARSLAGETNLRELCAALKACDVVITNDTGPMHVAAAVGTPVVVPFGSTSPELTGPGLPWDKTHTLLCGNVPCAPCFRRECPIDLRCLRDVSVDQVVSAALQLLR